MCVFDFEHGMACPDYFGRVCVIYQGFRNLRNLLLTYPDILSIQIITGSQFQKIKGLLFSRHVFNCKFDHEVTKRGLVTLKGSVHTFKKIIDCHLRLVITCSADSFGFRACVLRFLEFCLWHSAAV